MCVLCFTFRISKLGSGSDFEAYFQRLGIASGRVRYTKNKVSYFLWDFPGNNSGVGCHFLLQCMKVESESEIAQLSPTLSDPMDCSPPGPSVHGIFQARALEWGTVAL